MDHSTPRSHSRLGQVRSLITLLRPKQWIKNGFVLTPLIFSASFLNSHAVYNAIFAMLLFCLGSSATYVMNDLVDIEQDRCHPEKSKTRPLAAGTVSFSSALLLLAGLYSLLIWGWLITPSVGIVIAEYMALNLAYTFVLKNHPVIDIFTVSIGFVLRVYAGAIALSVPVSAWMFVTTFALTLYLASVKRKQEMAHRSTEGRSVLKKYTPTLINRYTEMAGTSAIVFYSMFVASTKPELVITVPLVLFGLFRYWYVVEALEGGESPTDVLLKDWQLSVTVILWVVSCLWILRPA